MSWWKKQSKAIKAFVIVGTFLVVWFGLPNVPPLNCSEIKICFTGPPNRINLSNDEGSDLLVQFNTAYSQHSDTSLWRAYQVGYVGGDWQRQCLSVSHFALPDDPSSQRTSENAWCFEVSAEWPLQNHWVAKPVDNDVENLWISELSKSDPTWMQLERVK